MVYIDGYISRDPEYLKNAFMNLVYQPKFIRNYSAALVEASQTLNLFRTLVYTQLNLISMRLCIT